MVPMAVARLLQRPQRLQDCSRGRWGWLLWEYSTVDEFPEPLPRALFLKIKFLLFKPAAPNKHLASHTAQLSNQTRDYQCQGPSRPNSSPFSRVTWLPDFSGKDPVGVHSLGGCTPPLCFCHFVFISPQRLQASMLILKLLKPTCLAEEGAIDLAVFQESCQWPGRHRAWSCSHPGPCTGPRDLMVPKQSPYCLIFQCPVQFWPTTFIYAGIPLAAHSVPQKIG